MQNCIQRTQIRSKRERARDRKKGSEEDKVKEDKGEGNIQITMCNDDATTIDDDHNEMMMMIDYWIIKEASSNYRLLNPNA